MTTQITIEYDHEYISDDVFMKLLGLQDEGPLISVTFNNLSREVLIVTRRPDEQ
jgi:hypothetical protein